jgi:hypothetical protein
MNSRCSNQHDDQHGEGSVRDALNLARRRLPAIIARPGEPYGALAASGLGGDTRP